MKHRTGHLLKRGENFYVYWRINGKAFCRGLRYDNGQPIKTKRDAEDARARFMAQFAVATEVELLESLTGKLEGRKAELTKWEDEKNPALPITRAWSEFLASPNRPDSGDETMYQYECQWSRFAEWVQKVHPNVVTLRDVSKAIAEEYAGSLNHGTMSPNSYNKHLNLLALVFRTIKGKAKLAENIWESPKRGGFLQRKRLITQSRRELTVEELKKTCQSATGELRLLFALGVYSGLRLGDCSTLRWGEVDLARRIICRIPNKTARRNPKPVIVPIHPALLHELSQLPVNQHKEYVLPETAALYAHRSDAVTDLVQKHFKACGIKVWKTGTGPHSKDAKRAVIDVGFHSLRHTFVSLCRESNAPLAVVESIVGHSSPAMTRHYTHVGQLAASNAVAALPALMGDAEPEPPKRDAEATLREIRVIAGAMTGKTWKQKQTALLTLLDAHQSATGKLLAAGQTAPAAGI